MAKNTNVVKSNIIKPEIDMCMLYTYTKVINNIEKLPDNKVALSLEDFEIFGGQYARMMNREKMRNARVYGVFDDSAIDIRYTDENKDNDIYISLHAMPNDIDCIHRLRLSRINITFGNGTVIHIFLNPIMFNSVKELSYTYDVYDENEDNFDITIYENGDDDDYPLLILRYNGSELYIPLFIPNSILVPDTGYNTNAYTLNYLKNHQPLMRVRYHEYIV